MTSRRPRCLLSRQGWQIVVEFEDKALSLAFFADPDETPLYLAEMKSAYR